MPRDLYDLRPENHDFSRRRTETQGKVSIQRQRERQYHTPLHPIVRPLHPPWNITEKNLRLLRLDCLVKNVDNTT